MVQVRKVIESYIDTKNAGFHDFSPEQHVQVISLL